MLEKRWAPDWWRDLASVERNEFERTARDLVGRLAILRTLVTEAGAP
jgi:hypothetical protein